MPYIPQERRDMLDVFDGLLRPETAGELNFVLTRAAIDYIEAKGLNYQSINDVLGAFDGASREFYRRVAAPYENNKIIENGDVYP